MTPRERVLACLHGEKPDKVPMRDAPLTWTIERWEREGMRPGGFPDDFFENCLDGTDILDYSALYPPDEVLEDDGYSKVVRRWNGLVMRILPDRNSTPHVLDWDIKTRADWEALRERQRPLDADCVSQSGAEWLRAIGEQRQSWCCLTLDGLFARVQFMSMEETLPVLLEEPEWMKAVADDGADFMIQAIDLVRQQGVRLDGLYYNDDIAYKNGPMFSPTVFREIFKPGITRVCDYVHSFGGHVFMHTDGYITPLIPDIIEAGVDILDPLEAKAGVDLTELRDRFGRQLVWEGNIDAMKLYYGTKQDIEDEVKSKLSLFPEGGYIYRLDGPISEEASYDNYRWLIDCVHKYGKL
jgi:uroporphyrinogen decarboxylase